MTQALSLPCYQSRGGGQWEAAPCGTGREDQVEEVAFWQDQKEAGGSHGDSGRRTLGAGSWEQRS